MFHICFTLAKMNITYKIFLRTDHLNIDGTNTVCLRIIQNRKKKIYLYVLKSSLPTGTKKGISLKNQMSNICERTSIYANIKTKLLILSTNIFYQTNRFLGSVQNV